MRRAVCLDRDGVLIRDDGYVCRTAQISILPGVVEALNRLKQAGFVLPVISNQAAVARGLMTEGQVREIQEEVVRRIVESGGPTLDGFYFCPHHPNADQPAYRRACECRKPGVGLLTRAAAELGFDLRASYLVGDRPTDIVAGSRAGCRTVWLQTGQHDAAVIQTAEPMPEEVRADHVCADLSAAADWILEPR